MTPCSKDGKEVEASFLLSDMERVTTHSGLNGRATNVFSVECSDLSKDDDDLVVKVFWAEAARTREPDILRKVNDIARNNDDVKGHVPELLSDITTTNIRKRLGLDTRGARVLYMIVFRKFKPITELVGKEFLHAWWAAVKCHFALWKNGAYHRDISPLNLMYRTDEGKVVGVLNDFDLASAQETPTRTECTGTVLFMAGQLLGKAARRGKIKHLYEHDVESFIWVLIWIVLRYANGKLRGDHERPLDAWLTADVAGYREKKGHLFCDIDVRQGLRAGASHEENWELAQKCISALMQREIERAAGYKTRNIDTAFERFLMVPTSHYL